MQAIDAEVVPLQAELTKLLEKFGNGHPTVRGVQRRIDQAKSRLESFPPAPVNPNPATALKPAIQETPKPAPQPQASEVVAQQLRQAKRELEKVQADYETVLDELIACGNKVALQEQSIKEKERIETELAQQQRLLEHLVTRLDQIPSANPSTAVRCEVLEGAGLGIQVEPKLQWHLLGGGGSGFFSGLFLSLLAMVATRRV